MAEDKENLEQSVEVSQDSSSESAQGQENIEMDELALAKEKIKELEDRYLRTHADFENTKKRIEREKYQLLEYANEKFSKDLLSIADALEMALNASNNESADSAELLAKMRDGISLTLENLHKVFNRHGIEKIESLGGFDPNFHEAVMQVVSESHNEGEIVQMLQQGYKYKDRVLRPAMVSVCKK